LIKKSLINNQIKSRKVRLIDETGKQLGVTDLTEALRISRERNLDLIQVTDKVDPPVCKITDYGKYLYQKEKKEKNLKKISTLKEIRIGFNTSLHDLETKAKTAEKFLKKGDKVKIEMRLRGREKALGRFAREKVIKFLEELKNNIPFKIERDLKRRPNGFSTIISKE